MSRPRSPCREQSGQSTRLPAVPDVVDGQEVAWVPHSTWGLVLCRGCTFLSVPSILYNRAPAPEAFRPPSTPSRCLTSTQRGSSSGPYRRLYAQAEWGGWGLWGGTLLPQQGQGSPSAPPLASSAPPQSLAACVDGGEDPGAVATPPSAPSSDQGPPRS